MERDVRRAEEEEKWREKANNTDQWKQLTRVAVQRSDNYTTVTNLTPTKGRPRGRISPSTAGCICTLHLLYL